MVIPHAESVCCSIIGGYGAPGFLFFQRSDAMVEMEHKAKAGYPGKGTYQ